MAILRSVLSNHIDEAQANALHDAARDKPFLDISNVSKRDILRTRSSDNARVRESVELDTIVAKRPVGAAVPRDEPKSIDDPTPPARISWEPPRKRYVAPKPYKSPF